MIKKYPLKSGLLFALIFIVAACKKENKSNNTATTNATPTQLGIYGATGIDPVIDTFKSTYIVVAKIGTKTVTNYLLFDTGSGGMVIDASEYLPTTAYTTSGFTFTGDSTVVNGITITKQTSVIAYGDDNSKSKVYGNLAYADITIGDQNGSVNVTRVPFFIYYKAFDSDGTAADQGEYDTFGASPQYDLTFNNGAYITSPFSYFSPGTGLTKGFKMRQLNAADFSFNGTFAKGAITLGLTSNDLSTSSGFSFTPLTFYSGEGYFPIVPATVSYNGKTASSSSSVFDTGTSAPQNFLEDSAAPKTVTQLAANSPIKISTTSGFNFSFSSGTSNIIYLENPTVSGVTECIFGLQFFLNNEYLIDYTNHKLGLKNN